MRTNGKIYRQTLTGGGLNDYGEPTEAVQSWDDGTPCLIQTLNDTRKGKYKDGQFRQSSYSILVEDRRETEFNHIKLIGVRNEQLGEFDVLSVEVLPSVGRVKIMV